MKRAAYIWFFATLGFAVAFVISQVRISYWENNWEQASQMYNKEVYKVLRCGATLNTCLAGDSCEAELIMVKHAGEECDRLVEKASEGLDTCMANVEFFKELAAYNESNLDTCLYDLRVERGQRTDGN